MTSPITLLTALGTAEPAAPTPAPEDPGLFNAVLTAALQAGMLPPVPPSAPATATSEAPPLEEEAAADSAAEDGTSEAHGEAPAAGADPATRVVGESGQEPVSMPAEAADRIPATGRPVTATPRPVRVTREAPAPAPPGEASLQVTNPPRTPGDESPARPPLTAAVLTARAAARALALLEAERPTASTAGEVVRGPRTRRPTEAPVPATPPGGPAAMEPGTAGDLSAAAGVVVLAVSSEAPKGAPVATRDGAAVADGEGRAGGQPAPEGAPRDAGIAPGVARVRGERVRPTAPDGSMPPAVPVGVAPALPATAPAEREVAVPLAATWNAARRAAQPASERGVTPTRSADASDPRPASAEGETDRDTIPVPDEARARTAPPPEGVLPPIRVPMAPPAPAPRRAETVPAVAEDEAEALIARARRNLEAPAAALPSTRWGRARAAREPANEPQATTTGDVRRAVPTVPAVEALMEALARTLEGAEVTAVRVTMGQGRPAVAMPDSSPEEAPADVATDGPPVPAMQGRPEGTAAPRATSRGLPVERLAPREPHEGTSPAVGAAGDDDRAPTTVDRLVVERAPARAGRVDLTGFEPTGRALREAVASRPEMVAAPVLPSDRQELPVASRGDEPRAARRDPEERIDAHAPSDAGARGSASAPDARAREPRGVEGADRAAPREAHELREAWVERGRPAGAADRVTLQVADSDGRQTRIRVSVLGDQVRATILPPDSTSARQLEQRMDELQAALVRQGFTDAKVSVQAGRGEGALPWGASQAVAPNELRSSSGTDQPPGDQRQGTGRRDGERQGDGQRHPHQRPRERDPNDRRRN